MQCDILAAEQDNNISVQGVAFDLITVETALPACRSDYKTHKNNPRIIHNLARVLDKAGKDVEAVNLYKKSAALGFDWSQNNLAIMYMNAEGVELDFVKSMYWLRKAFAQGNRQAQINYADTDLTSLFVTPGHRLVTLQRALQKLGFLSTDPVGGYDEMTRKAVVRYKEKQRIRGAGITFQTLDELNIIRQILTPKSQ